MLFWCGVSSLLRWCWCGILVWRRLWCIFRYCWMLSMSVIVRGYFGWVLIKLFIWLVVCC